MAFGHALIDCAGNINSSNVKYESHRFITQLVEVIVSKQNTKERIRVGHTARWWKHNNFSTQVRLQDSGSEPEMPPMTVHSVQVCTRFIAILYVI